MNLLKTIYLVPLVAAVGAFPNATAQTIMVTPGEFWLGSQGLKEWEWDIDHDKDGLSTRLEYYAGTNPFDASSVLATGIEWAGSDLLVTWDSQLSSRYDLLQSPDLIEWDPQQIPVTGDGGPAAYEITPIVGGREFFSLLPLIPVDSDGDGLSDREEALLGTDANNPNTDGDAWSDPTEVLASFTNPLVFDPAGATISGTVLLDDDLSGDLTDASPIAAAVVFLDTNFNTVRDPGEPFTRTDSGGAYAFVNLRPGIYEVRQELGRGETQTVPVEVTPELPDRLPDEVVNYTHAAPGVGALDVPYGYTPIDDYPGFGFVVLGARISPVDPALLLLPLGNRVDLPPIGSFAANHFLTLPETASVTVRFDEIIYDGPGPDFLFAKPSQGSGNEPAQIFFGPSEDDLFQISGTSLPTAKFVEVDLADYAGVDFVQFIRFDSETKSGPGEGGTDRGYGLGGMEGINVLPLSTSARRIIIAGTEMVSGQDFGRYFQDLAPSVLLSTSGVGASPGEAYRLHLVASDDLGIVSRELVVNGQTLVLDESGVSTFTPGFPGKMEITGTATDTGGQTVTRNWIVYVLKPDGSLPFDPSALPGNEGLADTRIEIFSPSSGAVPTADAPIIGSIVAAQGEAVWRVEYAPIGDVDPSDLAAVDPDYQELASGQTNVFSDQLATFPTSTLADGIYFIRVVAQPAAGGTSALHGQVIAINVDPATLNPAITILSPLASVGPPRAELVQDIRATLTSDRTIESWSVSYSVTDNIDLTNLGAPDPDWVALASGSGVFSNQTIASLDTSLLPNGSYILRVTAFNDLRLGRLEAVEFEVSSPAKLGRNRVEFTDFDVSLAGIPLTLTRVYDSLDTANSGDFGFGWSLDIGNPNLVETVPDTGANLFGATPYKDGTRIYLNAPDGQRIAFTFRPELVATTLIGTQYRAAFEPDPGNPYTLAVPEGDDGFLNIRSNGEARLLFVGLPWNPDNFLLSDGSGLTYNYDQRLGLRDILDSNDNRLTITPTGISHSSGPQITFQRDAEGRITSATGPSGRTIHYGYSIDGDLITVDKDFGVTTHGYSALQPHFLTSVSDPFGRNGTQFEYDADGRLIAIIDPEGNRSEQSWDPAARTGSITDRRGNITTLVYDERGNVLTETNPLGHVTTYKYEDSRHPDIETEIITQGSRRRFTLDAKGRIIATRYGNEFFASTSSSYNPDGNILENRSIGGFVERHTYDERGNRTSTVFVNIAAYSESKREYLPNGETESVEIDGETVELFYDPVSGRLKTESGPFGHKREFEWTVDGRLASYKDAGGVPLTITYDDATKTAVATDRDGGVLTRQITNGEMIATDQMGEVVTLEIDGQQRETKRTFPDGSVVEPTFDAEGNPIQLDRNGIRLTSFEFDALNRMTNTTDGAGAIRTRAYNADGQLVESVNRLGKKITYEYNHFGQITHERWVGLTDEVVRDFTYTYGGLGGALRSVTDGSSTWVIRTASDASRPTSVIYQYPGQEDFTLGYDWLNSPRLVPSRIRHTVAAGFASGSDFRRISRGDRTFALQFSLSQTSSNGNVRYRYSNEGRITSIERFDAFSVIDLTKLPVSRTNYGYTNEGRLASISHRKGDGSLAFPESAVTFSRDPIGRITSVVRPSATGSYGYDVMGQLISEQVSGLPEEVFPYDGDGNPSGSIVGTDNRLLALGALTFTYDAEGNVSEQTDSASGEIRSFSYDHRNQLIRVGSRVAAGAEEVIVAEYEYDYRGKMMSRSQNGVKHWLVYDRDTLYGEFADGADSFDTVYLYDMAEPNRHLGVWTATDGIRWHLTDQIGSVRGVVSPTGAPLHWLDYSAFGTPRMAVPADFGPIRFAGRYWNEAAGLYENQLRHYNPVIGRFQQQDPIGFQSGDFNLYRYAGNNPISGTDPTGATSAIEYVELIFHVLGPLDSAYTFGTCVDQILGGVADAIESALKGGGAGAPINTGCFAPGWPFPYNWPFPSPY